MSITKKHNKQVMNNQIKKMDSKTLSSISKLITQNPNVSSKAKRKSKKKGKVAQDKIRNNLQNNASSTKTKKRKKKAKLQIERNTKDSNATNAQKSDKSKKKKIKRLQNKPTFKLDQQKKQKSENNVNTNTTSDKQIKKDMLNVKFIKNTLKGNTKVKTVNSLRERMLNQLKSSQFRYLNEQLYTSEGKEAKQFFQSDRESFEAYHEGFRQQVSKWPMNPIDKIITAIRKLPKNHVIADFGCGEAKLARSVPQKVHSFDLVETVPGVVACDMAHCKLPAGTVDVAVYCLSLMGTNLQDYLAEANRVLKVGGILKIAEVESRFDRIENFIQGLQRFGFKYTWKDLSHNLFYFLDFQKERNIVNKNKLPSISLNPCLYKKR